MDTHTSHNGDEAQSGERRLLRFELNAGELKGMEESLKNEQQSKDKVETQETIDKRKQELVNTTNGVLSNFTTKLQGLPMGPRVHTELIAYLQRAAHAAERNGIPGLGEEEFLALRQEIEKQVKVTLEGMLGGLDEGKHKAEAEAKQKELEAHRKKRSIETVQRDMEIKEKAMKEMFERHVNIEKLGDPERPQDIEAEVKKFQDNQEKLQKAHKELQDYVIDAHDLYEKAGEQLKSEQEPPLAIAATGAAVGAAIGVWFGGIGTVPGALLGAGIALAGYMIVRAANHFLSADRVANEAAKYNGLIEGAKKQAAVRNASLRQLQTEQEADGSTLGLVNGNLTKVAEERLAKREKELAAREESLKKEREGRMKHLDQIEKNRKELEGQGKILDDREQTLVKQGGELAQGEIQLKTQQIEAGQNSDKVNEAIKKAEDMLKTLQQGGESDQKAKSMKAVQDQLAKLYAGREQMQKAGQELTKAGEEIRKSTGEVQAAQRETSGQRMDVIHHDLALHNAGEQIGKSLPELNAYQEELNKEREALTKNRGEQMKVIGEISGNINTNILTANITNAKSETEAALAVERVNKIPDKVEVRGAFADIVQGTFEGAGHAVKYVFVEKIAHGLEWFSGLLKTNTAVAVLTAPIWFTIDVAAGIIHGAGEMVEGLMTMLAHPLTTLSGMGAMIGRNPETGEFSWATFGNAWKEMGKALASWKDFEEGNVGRGVGKIALNVIMTATGIEAVGAGATAARAAYAIARAGGASVSKATLRAAGAGITQAAAEFGGTAWEVARSTFQIARLEGSGVASAAGRAALAGVRGITEEIGSNIAKLPGTIAHLPGEIFSTVGHALAAPYYMYQHFRTPSLLRLERAVGSQVAAITEQTIKMGEYTIGGRRVSQIPQLAGKTAEQIKAMTAAELIAAGITDARALRQLRQYRKLVFEHEGMAAGLQSTRLQHHIEVNRGRLSTELAQQPGLEKILDLTGKKLDRYATEFNGGRPLPSRANEILHYTDAGEMVVFDASGRLQVLRGDAISTFISETVQAGDKVGRSALRISNHADAARLRVAEQLLGRKLTAGESLTILQAHELPGTLGNLTKEQVAARVKVLREGLLEQHMQRARQQLGPSATAEEIRREALRGVRKDMRTLMDNGITGKMSLTTLERQVTIPLDKKWRTFTDAQAQKFFDDILWFTDSFLATDLISIRVGNKAEKWQVFGVNGKNVKLRNPLTNEMVERPCTSVLQSMHEAGAIPQSTKRTIPQKAPVKKSSTPPGEPINYTFNPNQAPRGGPRPKNLDGMPQSRRGEYVLGKSPNGNGYEVLAQTPNGSWKVQHGVELAEGSSGVAAKIEAKLNKAPLGDSVSIGRSGGRDVRLVRDADGTFHLRVDQSPRPASAPKRKEIPAVIKKDNLYLGLKNEMLSGGDRGVVKMGKNGIVQFVREGDGAIVEFANIGEARKALKEVKSTPVPGKFVSSDSRPLSQRPVAGRAPAGNPAAPKNKLAPAPPPPLPPQPEHIPVALQAPPGEWMEMNNAAIFGADRVTPIGGPAKQSMQANAGQFHILNGNAVCILPDGTVLSTPVTSSAHAQALADSLIARGYRQNTQLNTPSLYPKRFQDPVKANEWRALTQKVHQQTHTEYLKTIDPSLENLTAAARNKNPAAVNDIVAAANRKGPYPKQAGQILEVTNDGGLVAVDINGVIRVIPAKEVPDVLGYLIEHAHNKSKGKTAALDIAGHADGARIRVAEVLLNRKLTTAECDAILRAHHNIPGDALASKAKELRDAGFTKRNKKDLGGVRGNARKGEVDILMRSGVTGFMDDIWAMFRKEPAAPVNPALSASSNANPHRFTPQKNFSFGGADFKAGQEYRMFKNRSGKIEVVLDDGTSLKFANEEMLQRFQRQQQAGRAPSPRPRQSNSPPAALPERTLESALSESKKNPVIVMGSDVGQPYYETFSSRGGRNGNIDPHINPETVLGQQEFRQFTGTGASRYHEEVSCSLSRTEAGKSSLTYSYFDNNFTDHVGRPMVRRIQVTLPTETAEQTVALLQKNPDRVRGFFVGAADASDAHPAFRQGVKRNFPPDAFGGAESNRMIFARDGKPGQPPQVQCMTKNGDRWTEFRFGESHPAPAARPQPAPKPASAPAPDPRSLPHVGHLGQNDGNAIFIMSHPDKPALHFQGTAPNVLKRLGVEEGSQVTIMRSGGRAEVRRVAWINPETGEVGLRLPGETTAGIKFRADHLVERMRDVDRPVLRNAKVIEDAPFARTPAVAPPLASAAPAPAVRDWSRVPPMTCLPNTHPPIFTVSGYPVSNVHYRGTAPQVLKNLGLQEGVDVTIFRNGRAETVQIVKIDAETGNVILRLPGQQRGLKYRADTLLERMKTIGT